MADPETRGLAKGRSEGLHLLRGCCCLKVLFLGHLVYWAGVAHEPDMTPAWAQHAARVFNWIFQRHGELSAAVICFIVLSGYCVHRRGLRGDRPLRHFAVRRAFRILPIFLLATIVGILLLRVALALDPAKTVLLTGTRDIGPGCVVAKITALASLWPIAHPCDYLGNAPLLTVMVLIGIYVLYGTIFCTGRRWPAYAICAASLATGIVISAYNTSHPLLYNWWQNSSVLAVFPYWWIGVSANDPTIRKAMARWTPALILAWLALTLLSQTQIIAVLPEFRKLVSALLIAKLIVWADGARLPRTPISMLGRASYSIYAFHGPLIVTTLLAGFPWWAAGGTALAAGAVSYVLFERPIDMFGKRVASHLLERPETRVRVASGAPLWSGPMSAEPESSVSLSVSPS